MQIIVSYRLSPMRNRVKVMVPSEDIEMTVPRSGFYMEQSALSAANLAIDAFPIGSDRHRSRLHSLNYNGFDPISRIAVFDAQYR